MERQVQDDGGTANGGVDLDPKARAFFIGIVRGNPWHNREIPTDVNGDRAIAPADALAVIDYINAFGAGNLPAGGAELRYYDVNGDGWVSASDALAVINYINAFASPSISDPEGEGESIAQAAAREAIYQQLSSTEVDRDWLGMLDEHDGAFGVRRRN